MYNLLAKFQKSNSSQSVVLNATLTAMIVLAATVFPRLMVIGGLPMTDEGVYAFFAQNIHANLAAGRGLPDAGWLTIYPILVSWVFELTTNHMILLRLVDLLVAAISSWQLCHVIYKESGSRVAGALITLVFLFIMNQPLFIECGFKNSIFAAYIPLFIAMRLEQSAANGIRVEWVLVGALTALAVLLRETFLHFLIIGTAAILIAYGWRACLRFALGATVASLIIILGIVLARGSAVTIIESYHGASVGYAAVADQRVQLFIFNGILSAREAAVAIFFGGLSIIAIIIGLLTSNHSTNIRRFAFWGSVALAPLLEPALKIGFPYHFAVCLPGLAGLSALGWKSAVAGKCPKTKQRLVICAAVISSLLLFPKIVYLAKFWPETRDTLYSANSGTWPSNTIAKSNYLLAAAAIRKVALPNATLSVSGSMLALYPLTGLLPPSFGLCDLSRTLISLNLDAESFRQALLTTPPDVLMTTTRKDWPGADTLTNVVIDSGLYEEVASIPVAPDKAYGGFGGTVYRRIVSHQ